VYAIAQIATAEDCSEAPSPIIGCIKTDPPFIAVTYDDDANPPGTFSLKCGDPLTIDQASNAPTLSVIVDQPTDYYTILLVDTSDSFLHPILHYGATNVLGFDLLQFSLSELSNFSSYRGPAPPAYIPGIQSQQFNYEFIVSKQSSLADNPPVVQGNTQFNYTEYLNNVNATMISATYFSSGFCVKNINETASGDGNSGDEGDASNDFLASATIGYKAVSMAAILIGSLL
jgi:hypothetical protein